MQTETFKVTKLKLKKKIMIYELVFDEDNFLLSVEAFEFCWYFFSIKHIINFIYVEGVTNWFQCQEPHRFYGKFFFISETYGSRWDSFLQSLVNSFQDRSLLQRLSTWAVSANISSRWIASMSFTGFITPSTCTTFWSSKARTTWHSAWHSLRCWQRLEVRATANQLPNFCVLYCFF